MKVFVMITIVRAEIFPGTSGAQKSRVFISHTDNWICYKFYVTYTFLHNYSCFWKSIKFVSDTMQSRDNVWSILSIIIEVWDWIYRGAQRINQIVVVYGPIKGPTPSSVKFVSVVLRLAFFQLNPRFAERTSILYHSRVRSLSLGKVLNNYVIFTGRSASDYFGNLMWKPNVFTAERRKFGTALAFLVNIMELLIIRVWFFRGKRTLYANFQLLSSHRGEGVDDFSSALWRRVVLWARYQRLGKPYIAIKAFKQSYYCFQNRSVKRSEDSVSRIGECVDDVLLGCWADYCRRNLPTFQRCLLPPSSGWWVIWNLGQFLWTYMTQHPKRR